MIHLPQCCFKLREGTKTYFYTVMIYILCIVLVKPSSACKAEKPLNYSYLADMQHGK